MFCMCLSTCDCPCKYCSVYSLVLRMSYSYREFQVCIGAHVAGLQINCNFLCFSACIFQAFLDSEACHSYISLCIWFRRLSFININIYIWFRSLSFIGKTQRSFSCCRLYSQIITKARSRGFIGNWKILSPGCHFADLAQNCWRNSRPNKLLSVKITLNLFQQ